MTSKEVILQNLAWEGENRIGFSFSGEGRKRDFVSSGVRHNYDIKKWVEGDVEYHIDIWGNTWHRLSHMSAGGEIFKPVLEDWSQLDDLELPELDKPEFYEAARELCETDDEHFKLGGMSGWIFSTARYMRKMEIYFMDLVAEREKIDVLHEKLTDIFEKIITRYGEAGMDGIFYCEDLGVQDRVLIGPEMWRDVFRPHYERLTSKAHEYGMKVFQHSCGYNMELIDDLCEAGVDCLQFDQPAVYDMPALAEKLREHKVALFSPCDIQKVLPTGDKAFIEAETKRLVDIFRGGFIAKNYGDLHGIGVKPEWDQWAYETFVREGFFK